MKALFVYFGLFAAISAQAVSVCSNNVCGTIRCASGCIQRAVNGVCVENRCTGSRRETGEEMSQPEDSSSSCQSESTDEAEQE